GGPAQRNRGSQIPAAPYWNDLPVLQPARRPDRRRQRAAARATRRDAPRPGPGPGRRTAGRAAHRAAPQPLPGPAVRRGAAAGGGITGGGVQTIVIGRGRLGSTGACVLALALVADSRTPCDHAFAVQRGAQGIAVVDPARATAADVAATGRLADVTAALGPF